MSDLVAKKQVPIAPLGEIVAENVSREDFYTLYVSSQELQELKPCSLSPLEDQSESDNASPD